MDFEPASSTKSASFSESTAASSRIPVFTCRLKMRTGHIKSARPLGSVLINKFRNKFGRGTLFTRSFCGCQGLRDLVCACSCHWASLGLQTWQHPEAVACGHVDLGPGTTWDDLGRPGMTWDDLKICKQLRHAAPAPGKPAITRVPSLPLRQTGAWMRTHHPNSPAPRRFLPIHGMSKTQRERSCEMSGKVSCPPAVVPVHSRALESSP